LRGVGAPGRERAVDGLGEHLGTLRARALEPLDVAERGEHVGRQAEHVATEHVVAVGAHELRALARLVQRPKKLLPPVLSCPHDGHLTD
jgi:hypothetical protein